MEFGRWYLRYDGFDDSENEIGSARTVESEELLAGDESRAFREARLLWELRGSISYTGWNRLTYPRNPRLTYERSLEKTSTDTVDPRVDWSQYDPAEVRNSLVRTLKVRFPDLSQGLVLEFLRDQGAELSKVDESGLVLASLIYKDPSSVVSNRNWLMRIGLENLRVRWINLSDASH